MDFNFNAIIVPCLTFTFFGLFGYAICLRNKIEEEEKAPEDDFVMETRPKQNNFMRMLFSNKSVEGSKSPTDKPIASASTIPTDLK